ncbi:S-methyl-5'-thioadenosine phosphorylase MTAP [Loa loa]|uniref:S-methyl-5'-thioadenosine phosphorylase n=1 Tax=Loa loa TaxID=7209 RepID=A0A1I7VL65_LOALO|nr:S-methyl-5'-thioadenosine phosphorylase MTAP [Loa loa]EFO26651.1 S-methyl-5'-thioadenosine phosphorylase MTAP [Loa loa]
MDFKIGIIGGTGLEDPKIFSNTEKHKVSTPFGSPSDVLIEGKVDDITCILLSRHGRGHDISPTNINYRANLWALMQQGAKVILSTAASGSLKEELTPVLYVPNLLFDFGTFKREVTFHDGKDGHPKGVCHIPMHPAYNEKLRQVLISSAEELKYKFFKTGTALCIEGPRYSSRAESEVYRGWNADIINMTVCPEVYLAKELGIPFATTAILTDYDCWRDGEKVSVHLVDQRMRECSDKAKTLFVTAIKKIGAMHWDDEIMEAKKTARAGVMVDEHVVFDHLKY